MHPDSFAGAILEGSDPWRARVVSTSTRVALPILEKWAQRHTGPADPAAPLPAESGRASAAAIFQAQLQQEAYTALDRRGAAYEQLKTQEQVLAYQKRLRAVLSAVSGIWVGFGWAKKSRPHLTH